MEEDKTIKRKRIFRTTTKTISYSIIVVLSAFLLTLSLLILSAKLAEKKDKKPLIGLYTIVSESMKPNINVYDVVVVVRTNINKLKQGDIITFYSSNALYGGRPITHRIVSKNDDGTFTVKGDANEIEDEEKVSPDKIIGKMIIRLPELGKLQFFIASKSGWMIAILIPAIAVIGYDIYKLIKLIIMKIRYKKLENKHGNI